MWIVPVGVFVMTVLSMAETRYSMFKRSSSRNLLLAVYKSWQGRKGLKQRDRFFYVTRSHMVGLTFKLALLLRNEETFSNSSLLVFLSAAAISRRIRT